MALIDDQYRQAKEIVKYFTDNKQISMLSFLEPTLTKNLLLQSASLLETEIMEVLKVFSNTKSSDDKLSNFVNNFLLERQFNRLFNENQRNVNQFLGFFGEDFKNKCIKDMDDNELLKNGAESFMELIKTRNYMIHKNLANYNLEKTIDEVYALHNSAVIFMQYLRTKLLT